jgi:hypothetical protein
MDHSMDMAEMSMFRDTADSPYLNTINQLSLFPAEFQTKYFQVWFARAGIFERFMGEKSYS